MKIRLKAAAFIAGGYYERGAIVDVPDDYPLPSHDVMGEDGQLHPEPLAEDAPEEEAPPQMMKPGGPPQFTTTDPDVDPASGEHYQYDDSDEDEDDDSKPAHQRKGKKRK